MGRTSQESLRFTIKKRLAVSDKKSEQTLLQALLKRWKKRLIETF